MTKIQNAKKDGSCAQFTEFNLKLWLHL